MRLYFVPFACSLAVRAALDAAELDTQFIDVARAAELGEEDAFRRANPLGYVPVLEREDGRVLTEGPAILQWIADQAPDAKLAPPAEAADRYELQRWLNFISTELHKGVFTALLDAEAPTGAKDYARSKVSSRLDYLSDHLSGREYLLRNPGIADFYLVAILNWCETAQIDIAEWPVIKDYRARLRKHPSVARAIAAELPLMEAA